MLLYLLSKAILYHSICFLAWRDNELHQKTETLDNHTNNKYSNKLIREVARRVFFRFILLKDNFSFYVVINII